MFSSKPLNIVAMLIYGVITSSAFATDGHDKKVKQDLFAVITLEGHRCGNVTDFTRQGDADYLVACETGDRYHVYIQAGGRAVVEKQ